MSNYERIKNMNMEEMAIVFAIMGANPEHLERLVRSYSGSAVNEAWYWLASEVSTWTIL